MNESDVGPVDPAIAVLTTFSDQKEPHSRETAAMILKLKSQDYSEQP